MAGSDWTEAELRAAVEAYSEMLRLEQAGQPYSKAAFRRALRPKLHPQRTEAAIEYRMQNISAVRQAMGLPRINGYLPASNVGASIFSTLETLIKDVNAQLSARSLESVLPDPDPLMGVKAVFGRLSSAVLCFGGRGGDPNDKKYYSVPSSVAQRVRERPYVLTIGAGREVQRDLDGRVLNLAKLSFVYGLTKTLVTDPDEVVRLSQWPVAIAIQNAWRIVGEPHLIEDLGLPDRRILAGAQDGIIRPALVDELWQALRNWPIEPVALPFASNFRDPGRPILVISKLPSVQWSSEEGRRIWDEQQRLERDKRIAEHAKRLNKERYGAPTCEACQFSHPDPGMFDAHHPTPLAVGQRDTFAEHLEILCPTCHRRAHRAPDRLMPYTLRELRSWIAAGRP